MTSFSSIESKFRNGATMPSDPSAGDTFYNTANDVLYRYDGAKWVGIAFGTTTSTSTSTSITTSTSTSTTSTTTSTSTTISTTTSTSTTTTI